MTDARLAAALADRYRIERTLGSGGMATVHLAHDLRHGRDVAVKVLHPDLAAALGAERFLAEIRTTARLQHPHILPLLDSGEAAGLLYYVMPVVSGESLRQRLVRERQLPIEDAVRIAREAAAALDYAHRQGVVHRDIKPENILLHDGSALVADFGIALAVQQAGEQRLTQTGLSLGTPQYMSPEQAMGDRGIDARSDIYSLAAVTYEMLTGEPPFTGATVQAVVAKVMSADPQPVTMTRRNVPPAVAAAVHRGLEKLPADRQATAADFASSLSATVASSVVPQSTAPAPALIHRVIPWAAALVLSTLAFVAGRLVSTPDESESAGVVMATLLPENDEVWAGSGVQMAMSADGRHVAIVSRRDLESELIVRSLDSLGSRRLANTKGGYYPFWSPDGRSLGFFTDVELKVVDLPTGAVRTLCPAARPGGASWGADNVIIYVPERGVGLHRVIASSRNCERLPIAAPPQALDGRPRFLADGRHFVASTDLGAWLGAVDGDSLTKLTDLQRMRATVAGPDFLLFRPPGTPSGSIFAQRIDVERRTLVGEPVRILDGVPTPGGNTALSASNNGALVARTGSGGEGRLVGRFERSGAVGDTISALTGRVFGMHRLSRDGRKLALGGWEIVILDLERGVPTTAARSSNANPMQFPVWSPRDTALAWVTSDSGMLRIEIMDTRTSQVRALPSFARGRSVDLSDWSADGRYLAFQYGSGGGSPWSEAWILDLASGESKRVFEEATHVAEPHIAPHGNLIAYQAGSIFAEPVIYVRPFPGPGQPVRISPSIGVQPRWSSDGTELFYYDERSGVMSVSINRDASVISAPRVALPLSTLRSVAPTFTGTFIYDPKPDGKSFVGSVTRPRPINLTVVLNWPALLNGAARP